MSTMPIGVPCLGVYTSATRHPSSYTAYLNALAISSLDIRSGEGIRAVRHLGEVYLKRVVSTDGVGGDSLYEGKVTDRGRAMGPATLRKAGLQPGYYVVGSETLEGMFKLSPYGSKTEDDAEC